MIKQKFQKITFSLFFILAFTFHQSLLAVPFTWVGGGGNNLWSNSANWDMGAVPGSGDDVTIPAGSGVVRFNYSSRRAKSLVIASGATLRIISGAKLRLITTGVFTGITNNGILDVRGKLVLEHQDNTGIINNGTITNNGSIKLRNIGVNGVLNYGEIDNKTTGIMEFLDTGIGEDFNTETGILKNEGTIRFLAGNLGQGLRVGDGFVNEASGSIIFEDGFAGNFSVEGSIASNYGLIEMTNTANSILSYPFYLSPSSTFTNESSGEIIIDGCNGCGAGIIVTDNATLHNRGNIEISNLSSYASINILSQSRMSNGNGAHIDIDFGNIGINVGGEFENFGDIHVYGGNEAITVTGEVTNGADGHIVIILSDQGINNTYGGLFTNNGDIIFSGSVVHDIYNRGLFYNQNCGYISGDNVIENYNGTFENDAWIAYFKDGYDHIYTANQIVNTGVILDPYDLFVNALNNQGLRIPALLNPQANVPYINALDVAPTNTVIIDSSFLVIPMGASGGFYDNSTNVFTPNNTAIGATELYVAVNHNNCYKLHEIRIDGTVAPVTIIPNNESYLYIGDTEERSSQRISSFPNPTQGLFQSQLPQLESGRYQLRLINTQGQVILTQEGDATIGESQFFDLSNYPSGLYWIDFSVDGQLIAQEKIIRL